MRSLQDGYPSSSFRIVRFGINADEEKAVQEQERAGWTGHNPWVEWFCDEHAALGEELSHLHWSEAMERLRASQQ